MHPRDYFIANETTLYNLFIDGDYQFKIPDNQRHFSWGKLQLQQLWKDLTETVLRSYNSTFDVLRDDKIEPHFFGAIYLTDNSANAGLQDISDGQQRLISCTILLKLLSELAAKLDTSEYAGIQSLITPCLQKSRYGDPYQPRLVLDDTINGFFKGYILSSDGDGRQQYLTSHPYPPYMDSIANVIECCDFFKECLSNEFTSQLFEENITIYRKKLVAYIKTLLDLFVVLRIQVKKEATMYVIFETLNDRGLDLSESDLIKNLFFKQTGIDKQTIKDRWDSIAENIENEDLTSYIRFHYNSKNPDIVQPKNLFNKVKDYLDKDEVDPTVYLTDLQEESVWYGRLTLKGTPYWNSYINEMLSDLFKGINVSHGLPLLLAGAVRFGDNQTEFERFVKAVVAFCFRYFTIGNSKVDELEKKVNKWAISIRNGQTIDQCIIEMKTTSPDDLFKMDFSSFSTKANDLAFYILYQLEKHKGMAAGVIPYKHSASQHVEHIMPKNPGSNWPSLSADPLYGKYLYRIGNLMILEKDINQKIKNKGFSYKITNQFNKDYTHSALYYPKDIARKYQTWDFSTIENRQKVMAEEAISVWTFQ